MRRFLSCLALVVIIPFSFSISAHTATPGAVVLSALTRTLGSQAPTIAASNVINLQMFTSRTGVAVAFSPLPPLCKYPEGNNMAVVHLGARPVRV